MSVIALLALGGTMFAKRRWRSVMVALGLLTCSATLVHLTGGLIESHFHFFVVVPVLTLYGDWVVFLLAIAFVALHHGVLGLLVPELVFNHRAAWTQPWKWASIHAAYILGASAAALVAWRATEDRVLRDSLTQLLNAEAFLDYTEQALARAQRRRTSLALLYVDLDGFKGVNDSLGHGAGDQVLTIVGDRLRRSLRDSDVAARLGGDEFALLIEDVGGMDDVHLVSRRVLKAVQEPIAVRNRSVSISGSIGIAVADAASCSTNEELLKQADEAMYAAKRSGKGRYETSPRPETIYA
jgi:diguanylate cyclase (GGDEF)-like protein